MSDTKIAASFRVSLTALATERPDHRLRCAWAWLHFHAAFIETRGGPGMQTRRSEISLAALIERSTRGEYVRDSRGGRSATISLVTRRRRGQRGVIDAPAIQTRVGRGKPTSALRSRPGSSARSRCDTRGQSTPGTARSTPICDAMASIPPMRPTRSSPISGSNGFCGLSPRVRPERFARRATGHSGLARVYSRPRSLRNRAQ
jgi:hypothetical protein